MAWDNLRGTMETGNTVYVTFEEAQKEVERAVKEEREACAKIADECRDCSEAAAMIRDRNQQ
jgi:hypothetical protein